MTTMDFYNNIVPEIIFPTNTFYSNDTTVSFPSNLTNIEFYNKLNTEVSKKIKNINKKIITHNKTTLPFFITIVYMILIFLLNFFIVYIIIQQILEDKYDAYHEYIKKASNFININIYQTILKNLKIL